MWSSSGPIVIFPFFCPLWLCLISSLSIYSVLNFPHFSLCCGLHSYSCGFLVLLCFVYFWKVSNILCNLSFHFLIFHFLGVSLQTAPSWLSAPCSSVFYVPSSFFQNALPLVYPSLFNVSQKLKKNRTSCTLSVTKLSLPELCVAWKTTIWLLWQRIKSRRCLLV